MPQLKPLIGLALAALLVAPPGWAQTAQPRGGGMATPSGNPSEGGDSPDPTRQGPIWWAVDRPSLSAGLVGARRGYGVGASLTTPFRYGHRVAFRGGVERHLLSAVDQAGEKESQFAYTVFRAGVVAFAGMVADQIYLYAEGGALVLQPDLDVAQDASFGGYGQLGVELFPRVPGQSPQYSMFFELGLRHAPHAVAKELNGEPYYASGGTARAGARVYF